MDKIKIFWSYVENITKIIATILFFFLIFIFVKIALFHGIESFTIYAQGTERKAYLIQNAETQVFTAYDDQRGTKYLTIRPNETVLINVGNYERMGLSVSGLIGSEEVLVYTQHGLNDNPIIQTPEFNDYEVHGSISAFADNLDNRTLVTTTAPHNLTTGYSVEILTTTNYNGTFVIEKVSDTEFIIDKLFNGNDATGNFRGNKSNSFTQFFNKETNNHVAFYAPVGFLKLQANNITEPRTIEFSLITK